MLELRFLSNAPLHNEIYTFVKFKIVAWIDFDYGELLWSPTVRRRASVRRQQFL
jgi:hypothetical protein